MRRGLRQMDVAQRARVSATTVSLLERGHLDEVSLPTLRRVAAALEVRVSLSLRLPHGELDRLLNAGHAALHEAIARHIHGLPDWLHAPEVSFAIYSERGIIDILAFHPPSGALLVIEIKTELVSLEDLLSTMDVRLRHASAIAAQRGWRAKTVSAWVVFADADTNRRRVREHTASLRSAFPADGRRMRAWLTQPSGSIRALSFWANFGEGAASATAAMRRRVRKRAVSPVSSAAYASGRR